MKTMYSKLLKSGFFMFKVFTLYVFAFFFLSDGGIVFSSFVRTVFGDLGALGNFGIKISILLRFLLFPNIVAVLIIGLVGPFWVGTNRFAGFFLAGLLSATQISCIISACWKDEFGFMPVIVILGAFTLVFSGGYTYWALFNHKRRFLCWLRNLIAHHGKKHNGDVDE